MHAFRADPGLHVIAVIVAPGPWYHYREFYRPEHLAPLTEDGEYLPTEQSKDELTLNNAQGPIQETVLAQQISKLFGDESINARCITDKDSEEVFGIILQRLQELNPDFWPKHAAANKAQP